MFSRISILSSSDSDVLRMRFPEFQSFFKHRKMMDFFANRFLFSLKHDTQALDTSYYPLPPRTDGKDRKMMDRSKLH